MADLIPTAVSCNGDSSDTLSYLQQLYNSTGFYYGFFGAKSQVLIVLHWFVASSDRGNDTFECESQENKDVNFFPSKFMNLLFSIKSSKNFRLRMSVLHFLILAAY